MALKIYKKGAFVVIDDTVNGTTKQYNSAGVQIDKPKTAIDQYNVLYNDKFVLEKVQLSVIQDENGDAYTESAWDVFRYEQVGSVNTSEIANPYPGYTETIVEISSADILAIGTTPFELLPESGAGTYYDINNIKYEYDFVTTDYTFSSFLSILIDGNYWGHVSSPFGATDRAVTVYQSGSEVDVTEFANKVQTNELNKAVSISSFDSSDPTLGDGTLRLKIYHRTITFGA